MRTATKTIVMGALACSVALGAYSCKKKPAEKKAGDDKMDVMKPMDAMKAMDAMKPMDAMKATDAMRPRPTPDKPKKLTFEEQVAQTIPLTPKPTEMKLGKLTVKPALCKVEGIKFIYSSTSIFKSIQKVGKKLYVLNHKGEVLRLDVSGGADCKLTLDKSWGKEGIYKGPRSFNRLSSDNQGNVVASSFMGSVYIKGGKVAYECKARKQGSIILHPKGKWGLAYFVGSNVQHMTFGPKECKGKNWVLTDMSNAAKRKGPFKMIDTIGFTKQLVLVGGSLAKKVKGWNPHAVVAFDAKGKEKFRFGKVSGTGPEHFGWIHAIQGCKKGKICVVDSNYRSLSAWDNKGKFGGAVSLNKLFGVTYPWINDFDVDKKGVAWFIVGQSRKAKKTVPKGQRISVAEGLIYRVDGL